MASSAVRRPLTGDEAFCVPRDRFLIALDFNGGFLGTLIELDFGETDFC